MKPVFFIALFVFCNYVTHAQNYNCLQFGPKNYFINAENYVRGIRIDSVRSVGSDTLYFPYRTRRIKNYFVIPETDTMGASW